MLEQFGIRILDDLIGIDCSLDENALVLVILLIVIVVIVRLRLFPLVDLSFFIVFFVTFFTVARFRLLNLSFALSN